MDDELKKLWQATSDGIKDSLNYFAKAAEESYKWTIESAQKFLEEQGWLDKNIKVYEAKGMRMMQDTLMYLYESATPEDLGIMFDGVRDVHEVMRTYSSTQIYERVKEYKYNSPNGPKCGDILYNSTRCLTLVVLNIVDDKLQCMTDTLEVDVIRVSAAMRPTYVKIGHINDYSKLSTLQLATELKRVRDRQIKGNRKD